MPRAARSADAPRRRALALQLAAAALLLSACTSLPVDDRWARLDLDGLSYPSAYSLVATTLDGEGWAVRERDVESGTLVTDWRYGPSHREFRGPTRQKVHAEIEPLGSGCRVSLRVQGEVLVKGGILAHDPRASDDWEPVEDDFELAEVLLARIRSLARWDPGAAER